MTPRTSYWKSDSEEFVRATLPTAWIGTKTYGAFNIDGIAEMKTRSRLRANSLYCQVEEKLGAEIPMKKYQVLANYVLFSHFF